MNSTLRLGVLVLITGSAAVSPLVTHAAANPFAVPSTLPFHAPPFDLIKDGDYQPAFEEGIKQQLVDIDAIANNPAAPTFDNTLVAMERSGRMLERVNLAFNDVVQANTNPTLDGVQTIEAPKLAEMQDAIVLNPKLFARIKAVYDQRAALKLDPESLQLLTVTYEEFVHAGANLSPADKTRVKSIDKKIAELTTAFQQKLIAATKAGALVANSKAQLAGLSDTALSNAAHAAEGRGLKGKWLIPLANTTQQPALADLSDRATREQLFNKRWTATEKGNATDTRAEISSVAKLRAEKAAVLGYPNYAAWVLYDQMAKTPSAVQTFLGQLVAPVAAKAAEESKLVQAAIDKDGPHFDLQPWDWERYAARVQKERYDLDDNELKPYFEINTVLEQGVFYAANQLYGITFKRRKDIPVYQPDVMVYEVFDKDGKSLSLIYFDYFQRDNKAGGAWMDNLVPQSHLLGTKPVVYNVANFTKPTPGQPALITFSDVTAMFHEFGHALHGMFGDENYPSLSGTNTARDFVEFPSQFNEHWALYPAVLRHYALHIKTGQVIPDALVDKIKRAQMWGQGYAVGEVLAASTLDMSWHTLPASAPNRTWMPSKPSP